MCAIGIFGFDFLDVQTLFLRFNLEIQSDANALQPSPWGRGTGTETHIHPGRGSSLCLYAIRDICDREKKKESPLNVFGEPKCI